MTIRHVGDFDKMSDTAEGITLVSEKETEEPTIKDLADRIDCLQKNLASYKKFLIQLLNETADRIIKEQKKPKPQIEAGYRY